MESIVSEMVQKWKIGDAKDLAFNKIDKLEPFAVKKFWLMGRLLTCTRYNKVSLIQSMSRL